MADPETQDPASGMNVAQLRKVLAQEQKLGYGNRAVIGGMNAFLKNWGLQAHQAVAHPMVRSTLRRLGLLDPSYDSMAPHERAAWVEKVLRWAAAYDKEQGSRNKEQGGEERVEGRGTRNDAHAPSPSPSKMERGPGGEAVPRAANVPSQVKVGPASDVGAALRGRPGPVPAPAPTPTATSANGGQKAPAGPARRASSLLAPGQGLDTPMADVKGLTSELIAKLEKLGVLTVRDMLYYFPRRHIDFTATVPIRSLVVGQDQTVVGTVWESHVIPLGGKRRASEVVIGDETGNVRAIWFNNWWIASTLKAQMRVALSGRVAVYRGRKSFENPEHEVPGERDSIHTGRLVPIYPLTKDLSARQARSMARRTIDGALHLVREFLPQDLRRRRELMDLQAAIREAHFPSDLAAKDKARQRLAFDELFLIQLGVLGRKRAWKESVPAHPLRADPAVIDGFKGTLPFELTGAQERVIGEVMGDLGKSTAMSRLVQGEVGSGKTVIAVAGILAAVSSGRQAALMAPTELLAEQHFRTIARLLGAAPEAHGRSAPAPRLLDAPVKQEQLPEIVSFKLEYLPRPLTVALLMGSTSRKHRQEIQEMVSHGELDVLIGTHALFQKDVEFQDLGLAIVDEQHRFGVMQRTELRQKGYNPHLLVMTATPIPRSLALTLYGDLDLSVIDELPPGRQEIRTRRLDASEREKAYRFIRREVQKGRQAFIVYPLIEESDKLEVAAATKEYDRLSREVFLDPPLRLGLLHGRMKPAEKDEGMRAFRRGDVDVLVATAVVEVGIDVPNATVMMVDGAERFGMAQLHQFRGRVGRGEHESYCILIADSPSEDATERLGIMEHIQDGFKLAEEDLRLRGPGDFFGTRQSGLPDLRMAGVSDTGLLAIAREEATALFQSDPDLKRPEHQDLAREVKRVWGRKDAAMGEA